MNYDLKTAMTDLDSPVSFGGGGGRGGSSAPSHSKRPRSRPDFVRNGRMDAGIKVGGFSVGADATGGSVGTGGFNVDFDFVPYDIPWSEHANRSRNGSYRRERRNGSDR